MVDAVCILLPTSIRRVRLNNERYGFHTILPSLSKDIAGRRLHFRSVGVILDLKKDCYLRHLDLTLRRESTTLRHVSRHQSLLGRLFDLFTQDSDVYSSYLGVQIQTARLATA